MAQVTGVQYADAAAAGSPAGGGTQPATSTIPPPASAPAPFVTKTIPAGTTIQVRNNDTINSQTAREARPTLPWWLPMFRMPMGRRHPQRR